MIKSSSLILATSIALASASQAQVILSDTFSDGDIATSDVGNGFLVGSAGPGSTDAFEAGGVLTTASPTNGGRRSFFASNDSADTTTAGGAIYTFTGVNFAINADNSGITGNTRRQFFGVRNTAGAADVQFNPGLGFFFEVQSADVSSGDATRDLLTSNFFYVSADNSERVVLTSFTFDTLNLSNDFFNNVELDVSIALDATGYEFSVTGDTAAGAAISSTGTFADAGITNTVTTGHAFAFNQTENPNLDFSFDAIEIEAVPEPSSAVFLIGSLSAFALRRRRA